MSGPGVVGGSLRPSWSEVKKVRAVYPQRGILCQVLVYCHSKMQCPLLYVDGGLGQRVCMSVSSDPKLCSSQDFLPDQCALDLVFMHTVYCHSFILPIDYTSCTLSIVIVLSCLLIILHAHCLLS